MWTLQSKLLIQLWHDALANLQSSAYFFLKSDGAVSRRGDGGEAAVLLEAAAAVAVPPSSERRLQVLKCDRWLRATSVTNGLWRRRRESVWFRAIVLSRSCCTVAGQGASLLTHPRVVSTLLPAGLGDGDGRRHQPETRVRTSARAVRGAIFKTTVHQKLRPRSSCRNICTMNRIQTKQVSIPVGQSVFWNREQHIIGRWWNWKWSKMRDFGMSSLSARFNLDWEMNFKWQTDLWNSFYLSCSDLILRNCSWKVFTAAPCQVWLSWMWEREKEKK